MELKKTNSAAAPLRGAAVRAVDVKTFEAVSDIHKSTDGTLSFQAAYVANRYGISPCMARLVCQLAQIGGRLA